ILHRDASLGDEDADKALAAFVDQLKDNSNERIARQVRFFQMERKVIDSDTLKEDQIPALLGEAKDYLNDEKLTGQHLRMASSLVTVINRLTDADAREKYFAEFGELFSKSDDRQLAGYGKK